MLQFLHTLEQWIARRTQKTRWAVVVGWYAVIFTLSHIPASSSQSTKEMLGVNDMFNMIFRFCAHLGVFGVLAVLLYVALQTNFIAHRRMIILALLLTGICGWSDEWHQMFVPGRFFRVQDIATDIVGGALALLLVLYLYARVHRILQHR